MPDRYNLCINAIGQAYDTVFVSNDIFQLQHLLQLTLSYCDKYQVRLSASKTKLLVFAKDKTDYVDYVFATLCQSYPDR